MADRPTSDRAILFGPFQLFPAQQLLLEGDVRVRLSSRALDILTALVERRGEVVGKDELIARVWPNTFIDENTLRVHIAGLRKALGDGQAGRRYVANVPGRGYCFVAPISPALPAAEAAAQDTPSYKAHNLPTRLVRMVGREQVVRAIVEKLAMWRFVTIVGSGGVGKTTTAVAIAHASLSKFAGAAFFVDLGTLSDEGFVAQQVASALKLPIQSSDITGQVVNFLRDKTGLLVLDSCEHVIDAVSVFAERIFEDAPRVQILATSREALNVEGEHIFPLFPLDSPPDEPGLTAEEALRFPATQLFVDRVSKNLSTYTLTDEDAPAVAEICRRLDGIALAIELAAGRVSAFGVSGTAALFNEQHGLIFQGRRTAPARHQTLNATLDWSYNLLSECDRAVLRRLSIFVGIFTLEAAQAVARSDDADAPHVAEAIASLVTKSLISADLTGKFPRYRLLDTTRAYLLEKLKEQGELQDTARRHALYYRDYLGGRNANAMPLATGRPTVEFYADQVGNVRAALEWSFSQSGSSEIGISLAIAAGNFFTNLSLWRDCRLWGERALAAFDDSTRGTPQEMELLVSVSMSLRFTTDNSDRLRDILSRGAELSDALNLPDQKFTILEGFYAFYYRHRDSKSILDLSAKIESAGGDRLLPAYRAHADRLLGTAYNLLGQQKRAQRYLESAVRYFTEQKHADLARGQISNFARTLGALAGCGKTSAVRACPLGNL